MMAVEENKIAIVQAFRCGVEGNLVRQFTHQRDPRRSYRGT
jgi:hypothetical protein